MAFSIASTLTVLGIAAVSGLQYADAAAISTARTPRDAAGSTSMQQHDGTDSDPLAPAQWYGNTSLRYLVRILVILTLRSRHIYLAVSLRTVNYI